jgi:hypothetical protein
VRDVVPSTSVWLCRADRDPIWLFVIERGGLTGTRSSASA